MRDARWEILFAKFLGRVRLAHRRRRRRTCGSFVARTNMSAIPGPALTVSLPCTTAFGECWGDSHAFVAVGLLSIAYPTRSSANLRSSPHLAQQRRQRIREFSSAGTSVALRFVIASRVPPSSSWSDAAELGLHETLQAEEPLKDLVLLNVSENFFTCPRKYLLWLAIALDCFPVAQFIGTGDDDVFLQLPHLLGDLQQVHMQLQAEQYGQVHHVLYGRITWNIYLGKTTMDTGTFGGWSTHDMDAANSRVILEACNEKFVRSQLDAADFLTRIFGGWFAGARRHENKTYGGSCARLSKALVAGALKDGIDSAPPWPMAQGPLFAVSRTLARLMATDPMPEQWLAQLQETPMARAHRNNVAEPLPAPIRDFACFPMSDATFGYFLHHVAKNVSNVTLVNMPWFRMVTRLDPRP